MYTPQPTPASDPTKFLTSTLLTTAKLNRLTNGHSLQPALMMGKNSSLDLSTTVLQSTCE